jgi:hypothetical protein
MNSINATRRRGNDLVTNRYVVVAKRPIGNLVRESARSNISPESPLVPRG